MSDFPAAPVAASPANRFMYSTYSPNTLIGQHSLPVANYTAGGTWPSNNLGLYYHFSVQEPVTAYQMSCEVVTQSGNLDMGIYDVALNRLVSLGSTGVGAAGVQVGNIADTVLLPGDYYMAMSCSTTVASFMRATPNADLARVSGSAQQASALALPNPATFATNGQSYIPALAVYVYSTTV